MNNKSEARHSRALSFRYGFICHHREEAPEPSSRWSRIEREWRRVEIEEFILRLHPETPFEIHRRREGAAVFLGDVFSMDGTTPGLVAETMSWIDPWPALDVLSGRFAVLLLSGSRMRAANDAFGSRSLFYMPGRRAVASHSRLFTHVDGIEADPEVAEFMRRPEYLSRKVSYLPGDLTTTQGVYALVPNTCWDGERTRRYWPREPVRPTTLANFHSEMDRYFSAFVPFVRSRYTPVFGVTGGIDSRAAFAAFSGGFRGATWLANMKSTERPIIDRIVGHLALDHSFLDLDRRAFGDVARAAHINSGALSPKQGVRARKSHLISEAMHATYGPGHCFVRGYGGEILRGFPSYAEALSKLRPRALTIAYSMSKRRSERSEGYREFCDRAFEGFIARSEAEAALACGVGLADLFYWEHRMAMWAANMLNEMDAGCYTMVAFNSRPLFATAFGLPEAERLGKELLAGFARRHDRELAEIEYL